MKAVVGWGIAFVALVVVLAGTASADAPVSQGWWTTEPGGAALTPDVPPDGLLVQGGATESSPTAYAAVVFDIPSGATVGKLTFSVAPSSATTPTAKLRVCPLDLVAFTPAQGGPGAEGPAYRCGESDAVGVSGDAYQFDAPKMSEPGKLAIAILPASATDRVVLSAPGSDAAEVSASSEVQPDPSSENVPAGSTPGSPLLSPTGSIDPGPVLPTPDVGAAAPSVPIAGSVREPAAAQASGPLATDLAATPHTDDAGAEPILVALGLAAALLAGGMWAGAGRSVGGIGSAPAPADDVTGSGAPPA